MPLRSCACVYVPLDTPGGAGYRQKAPKTCPPACRKRDGRIWLVDDSSEIPPCLPPAPPLAPNQGPESERGKRLVRAYQEAAEELNQWQKRVGALPATEFSDEMTEVLRVLSQSISEIDTSVGFAECEVTIRFKHIPLDVLHKLTKVLKVSEGY